MGDYYNTLFKRNPRTNLDELEYIPKRKFSKQEKEEIFSYDSSLYKQKITVPQRTIIKPNVIDESPNSSLDINNYMKVMSDDGLLKKYKKEKALKKNIQRTERKLNELNKKIELNKKKVVGGGKVHKNDDINNFMKGLFKYLNK
jgi:hypothetical protein